MMCAVLDRNMVNWKLYFYDTLELPLLSEEVRIRVQHAEGKISAWKLRLRAARLPTADLTSSERTEVDFHCWPHQQLFE